MLTPITVDDGAAWDAGRDPGALRAVRLGRLCRLLVIRPTAGEHWTIAKVLGTAMSEHQDAALAAHDESADTLARLAAAHTLRDGERYALRMVPR